MSENIRSFIAVDLPLDVRKKLYETALNIKAKITGAKPIPPQNIHLTLKFLGYVSMPLIEKMKKIMDITANNFVNMDITLGGLGVFPDFRFPRVLWTAVERGCGDITLLKKKLDENLLSSAGIVQDKTTFKAHVTIARFKSFGLKKELEETILNNNIRLESKIAISAIHLYQSALTSKVAVYTKLHSSLFKRC